jgi:hypothetical protein
MPFVAVETATYKDFGISYASCETAPTLRQLQHG